MFAKNSKLIIQKGKMNATEADGVGVGFCIVGEQNKDMKVNDEKSLVEI